MNGRRVEYRIALNGSFCIIWLCAAVRHGFWPSVRCYWGFWHGLGPFACFKKRRCTSRPLGPHSARGCGAGVVCIHLPLPTHPEQISVYSSADFFYRARGGIRRGWRFSTEREQRVDGTRFANGGHRDQEESITSSTKRRTSFPRGPGTNTPLIITPLSMDGRIPPRRQCNPGDMGQNEHQHKDSRQVPAKRSFRSCD